MKLMQEICMVCVCVFSLLLQYCGYLHSGINIFRRLKLFKSEKISGWLSLQLLE